MSVVQNNDIDREIRTNAHRVFNAHPPLVPITINGTTKVGDALEVAHGIHLTVCRNYTVMSGVKRPEGVDTPDYIAVGDLWARDASSLEEFQGFIDACNASCKSHAEAGMIGSMWSIFLPLTEASKLPSVVAFFSDIRYPLTLRNLCL